MEHVGSPWGFPKGFGEENLVKGWLACGQVQWGSRCDGLCKGRKCSHSLRDWWISKPLETQVLDEMHQYYVYNLWTSSEYFKSSLEYSSYLLQCKCDVKSCQCEANSSFAFWNFLKFFCVTIFNLWLNESADLEPADTVGDCMMLSCGHRLVRSESWVLWPCIVTHWSLTRSCHALPTCSSPLRVLKLFVAWAP